MEQNAMENDHYETRARNRFVMLMALGIVGIGFASLLKLWSEATFFTYFIAIGVPGISIFLHGWRTYKDNREYARTAGFADSLYYMGFLLTMVALVAALIGYAAMTDGEESIIHTLQKSIPEFGTAIISTILGMGGRIYLVGFRNDPGEIEQMTIDTLENSMDNLRMQANDFEAKLKQASESWAQAVAELSGQAKNELQKAISETTSAIGSGAAPLRQALHEMTNSITSSAQSTAESLKESAESRNAVIEMCDKLKESSEKLSEVVRELAKVEPEKAGDATKDYIEKLKEFTDRFEAVAQQNRESSEAIERASEAASRARSDMRDIDTTPLQNELSRAQKTVQNIADDAERAQEQLPKWTPWRGEFWKNRFGKGK